MKVFIVAFLAVAASASPVWFQPSVYNTGVYNTGVYGTPLVHTPVSSYYQPLIKPVVPVVHKPVTYVQDDKINVEKTDEEKLKVTKTQEINPVVYGNPFYQPYVPVEYKVDVPAKYSSKSAGGVEHHVFKREADSQFVGYNGGIVSPYATPYVHQPYTHGVVAPYTTYAQGVQYPYTTYNTVPYVQPIGVPKVTYKKPEIESDAKVVANDANSPFAYAAKGQYVADSEGALHIAKRDAESQFIGYSGFTTPYTYSPYMTQYTKPVVYSHPTVYGYQQPSVYGFNPLKVKTYSNDAVKAEDYASKGQYHAETAGSVHIAKRDAESQFIGYNGVVRPYTTYQTPFVHRTLPYTSTFYNRATYPYNYFY